MNILVTGGAGYIGSILVPKLLKKGHQVKILDNFRYNQIPLLDYCSNKNLEIIRADVRDERIIKESIRSVEAIIPLACLVGAPICNQDPVGAKTINFEAVKSIIKLKSRNQL